LAAAAEEWLEAAQVGVVRTRSGDRYKPSALRSYRQVLHARVLPQLGRHKLSAITSRTLQDLVDQRARDGLAPSTIRNTLLPLRAIYRRALNRGEVAINPTLKLTLPAVRGRRDRVARPEEATRLIDALPSNHQALWATAFYAGLRLGELQALDWAQVDLDENVIHVERSWDRHAGFIEPKSRAGKRRVPIIRNLRNNLITYRHHKATAASSSRTSAATNRSTHQRSASTPRTPGQKPASAPSPCTNAATATPPT
jgi:integrase